MPVPGITLNKMMDYFLKTGDTFNLQEWCRYDDKGYVKKWSFSLKPKAGTNASD